MQSSVSTRNSSLELAVCTTFFLNSHIYFFLTYMKNIHTFHCTSQFIYMKKLYTYLHIFPLADPSVSGMGVLKPGEGRQSTPAQGPACRAPGSAKDSEQPGPQRVRAGGGGGGRSQVGVRAGQSPLPGGEIWTQWGLAVGQGRGGNPGTPPCLPGREPQKQVSASTLGPPPGTGLRPRPLTLVSSTPCP